MGENRPGGQKCCSCGLQCFINPAPFKPMNRTFTTVIKTLLSVFAWKKSLPKTWQTYFWENSPPELEWYLAWHPTSSSGFEPCAHPLFVGSQGLLVGCLWKLTRLLVWPSFRHMRRQDSVEKTIMLENVEGSRVRGNQMWDELTQKSKLRPWVCETLMLLHAIESPLTHGNCETIQVSYNSQPCSTFANVWCAQSTSQQDLLEVTD